MPIKETRVAILLSREVEFRPKSMERDKAGHGAIPKPAIPDKDLTATLFMHNDLATAFRRQRREDVMGEIYRKTFKKKKDGLAHLSQAKTYPLHRQTDRDSRQKR